MKIKLLTLLIAISLVLISCGNSSKSECTEIKKLMIDKMKTAAGKMPEAQRKAMLASLEKSNEQGMKACMAATPAARAKMLEMIKKQMK